MDVNELKALHIKTLVANFLIPLVALVVCVASLMLVYFPSKNKLAELDQELTKTSSLASQLAAKVKKLNDLLDFKTNVEENTELASRALASEPLVPQLLTQIDTVANDAGLAVNRLAYSFGDSANSVSSADYDLVAVSLGVVGSYEQLSVFLADMETAMRVVNVASLRFSTDTTNEDEEGYGASIVLASPYVTLISDASTDDPIGFDIKDRRFQDTMDRLKSYKYYEVTVTDIFVDLEENPEGADVIVDESAPPVETPAEFPVGDTTAPVDSAFPPTEPTQPEPTPTEPTPTEPSSTDPTSPFGQ